MPKLPSLSIAAKLYTIFALLATATLAVAGIALVNVRDNAALIAAMGIVCVLLAIAGIAIIDRAVARPLRNITRVTEEVAGGATGVTIPQRQPAG